jgi:UNC-50 family
MFLYVGQFLLLPLLLHKSFVSLLLSNLLYAVGFSAYFYITHLGYRRSVCLLTLMYTHILSSCTSTSALAPKAILCCISFEIVRCCAAIAYNSV